MFPVTAVDLSSSAIRAVYTVCRCLLIETSQINPLFTQTSQINPLFTHCRTVNRNSSNKNGDPVTFCQGGGVHTLP